MHTYQKRNHIPASHPAAQAKTPSPSVEMAHLSLSSGDLGQRIDLPGEIQSKMERAFGMDLSGVRLYRSQAVDDAGAHAVAQGSRIAFAPDHTDFSSPQGQALLGHELSHIVSQARGEAHGLGFLSDPALEAQADREGAMAARGEFVGPAALATGSLSPATALSASGPMQADLKTEEEKKKDEEKKKSEEKAKHHEKEPEKKAAPEIDAGILERAKPDSIDYAGLAENGLDTLSTVADKAGGVLDGVGGDILGGISSVAGTAKDLVGAGVAIHQAVTGTGEGDRIDQGINAVQAGLNAGASLVGTVSGFIPSAPGMVGDMVAGGAQMASGALGVGNAIRHGHMANTDKTMAKNVSRSIDESASERQDAEQVQNDQLAKRMTDAQQYTAGIHKTEAIGEGIHAGLDIAQGAASFIPQGGAVVKGGLAAIQKVSDFAVDQETQHEKKVAREANLGQEHMDLRRQVEEKLIAEWEEKKGGKLSKKEIDEIQKIAKHIVNQDAYGEGVNTNKMASMQRTKQDTDAMQELMTGDNAEEAQLAQNRMKAAGHAVGKDGTFVDQDEVMGKVNADLTGQNFDAAWSDALTHEDEKNHRVMVARAKAEKEKELKDQKKAEKEAEKERLKKMTPEEKKAYNAKKEADKKAQKEKEKQEKEAKKAQEKADKLRDKEAREEQQKARDEARKQEKQARDAYIKQRMASEENQKKGLFDKMIEKHRLGKEFDKQGEATKIENAAKGSASAGRKNAVTEAILHASREHDRARDSFVTEGFEELGFADKAKLVLANPAAYIASKTKSGKEKTAKHLEQQAAQTARGQEILKELKEKKGGS